MTLDPDLTDAFHRLAAAWTHHHDLKTAGAAIPELIASRQHLDALRARAARLRRSTGRVV